MSFPSQGYTPTTIPLGRVRVEVASTDLTSNQEWLASDIVPEVGDGLSSTVGIQFAFENRATIEVTLDGGTTWYKLNNNQKVEAETINYFEVLAVNTDQINFRTSTAGTLRFAVVTEIR